MRTRSWAEPSPTSNLVLHKVLSYSNHIVAESSMATSTFLCTMWIVPILGLTILILLATPLYMIKLKLGLVRNLQRQEEVDYSVIIREHQRTQRTEKSLLEQLEKSIILFMRDHVLTLCREETLDTAGLPTVLCCCLACNHFISAVSASLHSSLFKVVAACTAFSILQL